jgi:hypothetical protein
MNPAPLDLELPKVEIITDSAHCDRVLDASRLAGFGLSKAEPVGSAASHFDDPHVPKSPDFDYSSEDSLEDDLEYAHGVERSKDSWAGALPAAQGLYNPENEKDACGVGFICHIKG